MDSKEIQELLKLVNRLELAEFKYRQGDLEFAVKTKFYSRGRSGFEMMPTSGHMQHSPSLTTQPNHQSSQPPSPPKTNSDGEGNGNGGSTTSAQKETLVEIRCPIVGTFYRSPSADKPVYIKPGDMIEVGTVVCIVEAMKLFNEIESEVAGRVVKIVAEDASPVEYDQLLFLIDPNG